MASIDYQEDRPGPRTDALGVSLFTLHAAVGAFVMVGWIVASFAVLTFYLVLLPAVALQWYCNHGSCILNNLESRLRTGRWRHPSNREEGGFLLMLADWLFGVQPSDFFLNALAYCTVFVLWLAGFAHLVALTGV